jgi:hypothetical protein
LVTTVGFAIAWVRARERALRTRIEVLSPAPVTAASATQLERAIEAIAIEVERISEGQRFTTRLLAERDYGSAGEPRGASLPLPLKPVITPH